MTARHPPLLRLAAHVFLAAVLLLQATTTLAMTAGHGADRPVSGRTEAVQLATIPPCHVAASAPASEAAAPQPAPDNHCCGPADEGLCAWACSLVVAPPFAVPVHVRPAQPSAPPGGPLALPPSRPLPVPIEPPRVA